MFRLSSVGSIHGCGPCAELGFPKDPLPESRENLSSSHELSEVKQMLELLWEL
jgi:hypothetical protein